MARICSHLGPRYPFYNDKRKRVTPWWYWLDLTFAGPQFFPPSVKISPTLPRPVHNPSFTLKQPKASMGFTRGNRMSIKENKV
jgi:hypothetical protein